MSFAYKGLPVHIETIGSGKPLLILHGWGSSGAVMRPMAQSMALDRSRHLLDFPGFGQSPSPAEAWSVDDYADLVAACIRHIGGPVDLLAHSFGGRVALKLCARPEGKELVDKVLITGGAGMKPRRKPMYYIRKTAANLLKAPIALVPGTHKDAVHRWLRTTRVWKALGSGDYKTLDGVMRQIFVKTVTEFLEPCLPEIPHSVLLLWGAEDDATPLYQAERMRDGIADAALVTIEQAGHYAFLDQPGKFRLIADAFFAD
jgi:pimeloyl-ACP methyl ester carboxylesterase